MAKSLPVDFNEKRRVLYGKGQEKVLLKTAEGFLAEGRLAEALEFLERNRDVAMLDRVARAAVDRGDAFSLGRSLQLAGETADADRWRTLAANAERAERWYDAIRALERAGDEERAEELRQAHHPDYKPFKPAGK